MKAFEKSLIALVTACFASISVSASSIVPLKYDFDVESLYSYGMNTNWSSNVNRTDIDDVRVTDSAVQFVLGSNTNAVNAYITKNFDVPYVAGIIRVSFDVTLGDGSVFASNYGFPRFSSDDGGVGIINARANNSGKYVLRTNGEYLYYDPPSLLPYDYTVMSAGNTYQFDIDFNIDEGTYKVHRNGYALFTRDTSANENVYDFPYSYGELKKLEFGLTSCGAQQNVILDNVSITPLDYNYIYVSGNGSDDGDGTEELPFRTLSKAKEHFLSISGTDKTVIVVESGDYDIPDDITIGEVNIFKDKKVAIYPANNAVINMIGADVIIPELDGLNIKDEFVKNAMQKINTTYSNDFYQVIPEFETGVTENGFTVTTKNRGSREYVISRMIAFNNITGSLDKLDLNDMIVPSAVKKTVKFPIDKTYPKIYMFLFDNISSIEPIAPSQVIYGGGSTDE